MKIVVLISGNGSNLQAIIDRFSDNELQIAAVISNQPTAFGLQRAANAGLPTQVIDSGKHPSRQLFDLEMSRVIDSYTPDLIVLAGFMRILSPEFVERYYGKLINIHPSLLPKYKGLDTHRRVLEAGEIEHGITVHYVSPKVDEGPIIAQSTLCIQKNESEASLIARIHALEHKLYPHVIALIAANRIALRADVVYFDGNPLEKNGIMLNL